MGGWEKVVYKRQIRRKRNIYTQAHVNTLGEGRWIKIKFHLILFGTR